MISLPLTQAWNLLKVHIQSLPKLAEGCGLLSQTSKTTDESDGIWAFTLVLLKWCHSQSTVPEPLCGDDHASKDIEQPALVFYAHHGVH